jgi:hypothetical protein
MSSGALSRRLLAVAAARADSAVGRAMMALAARAAGLPGISVSIGDGVVLQGRGLVARAFGSRRRAADPRLRALTSDLQETGDQS